LGKSARNKDLKDIYSDQKSEASTAYKTEVSAQTKNPIIEKDDVDKKEDEGNYFEWH